MRDKLSPFSRSNYEGYIGDDYGTLPSTQHRSYGYPPPLPTSELRGNSEETVLEPVPFHLRRVTTTTSTFRSEGLCQR